VPPFRAARALRARAARARARAPAIGGLGLCAQPRALRRPGQGAGASTRPVTQTYARALCPGAPSTRAAARARARAAARLRRHAATAGARHAPVRALSMRCGPAHFGWGELGALRVAQLLRTGLACCVCARETRLGREGACRRVGAGWSLSARCERRGSEAPIGHALQLALTGGISGAGESACWLRRCVHSQRTGRLLLGRTGAA